MPPTAETMPTMDPQGGSAPSISRARSKGPAAFKLCARRKHGLFFLFFVVVSRANSTWKWHVACEQPAKVRLGGWKETEALDVGTRLLLSWCVLINRDTRRELTTRSRPREIKRATMSQTWLVRVHVSEG